MRTEGWKMKMMKKNIHPLGLLQLLVELIEGLAVFLSHLSQLVFVDFGFFFQGLLQMGHLSFSLGPVETRLMLIYFSEVGPQWI